MWWCTLPIDYTGGVCIFLRGSDWPYFSRGLRTISTVFFIMMAFLRESRMIYCKETRERERNNMNGSFSPLLCNISSIFCVLKYIYIMSPTYSLTFLLLHCHLSLPLASLPSFLPHMHTILSPPFPPPLYLLMW